MPHQFMGAFILQRCNAQHSFIPRLVILNHDTALETKGFGLRGASMTRMNEWVKNASHI